MALVTDYDCWHETAGDVSVEQILGYLRANAAMAQKVLGMSIVRIASRRRDCACSDALKFAIVTDPALISPKLKEDLKPIIGRYIH
jgi:5'-methylthioadenosine phosphorylase